MTHARWMIRALAASAAAAVLATGCVASSPAPAVTGVAATRVTATPVPTPMPPPPPPTVVTTDDSNFENSGGRLVWVSSRNAGPWPTDGSVELPTLGQHAPIVRTGVNTRGEPVVPGNARDVAWLDQGGWPGVTQNPVLSGHISYSRRAGTFHRLKDLKVGDPVHVTMGGVRYAYRVIWVRLYDRNTPHVEKIMGYTEVPSVTLVTCGGTFDRRAGTHDKRVVARAQIESVARA